MRKAFDEAGGDARFHGHTLLRLFEKMSKMLNDGPEDGKPYPESIIISTEPDPGLTRIETIIKEAQRYALQRCGGNVVQAAAWLGVSRNKFYTPRKEGVQPTG